MPACVACGELLARELEIEGFGLHPTCEPLEIHPDIVASEMFNIIGDALLNQPRSLQKRIGPSEIGIPCDRRIAYILARTPKVQAETVAWKPAIGTAMHAMFADFFIKANMASVQAGNAWRWHVEEGLTVGDIGPDTLSGSCDIFDGWTGQVWDWKFTTKNALREKYRPHGPGEQYRTQAHSYGKGWVNRGFTVRSVGIVFFTRDGEFIDRHLWHEPFDESIADAALERATAIARDLTDGMPMEHFATGDAMCQWCSWFRKGAAQPNVACPGHPTAITETSYPFDDLLPSRERAA